MIDLYNEGFTHLAGTTLGTLAVGPMSNQHPLRWSVRCTKCNARWDELHTRLVTYPLCRNKSCGRSAIELRGRNDRT
jgi:hypothetical protein